MSEDIKEEPAGIRAVELKFRWKYILLPLIFLFISVILFVIFYWQLSPQVAYRFNTAGAPGSTTSREMLAVLMLLPQLVFVLLGGGVAGTIIRIGGSLGQLSQGKGHQLSLFATRTLRQKRIDRAVANIAGKYGASCFLQAQLLDPRAPLPERRFALLHPEAPLEHFPVKRSHEQAISTSEKYRVHEWR